MWGFRKSTGHRPRAPDFSDYSSTGAFSMPTLATLETSLPYPYRAVVPRSGRSPFSEHSDGFYTSSQAVFSALESLVIPAIESYNSALTETDDHPTREPTAAKLVKVLQLTKSSGMPPELSAILHLCTPSFEQMVRSTGCNLFIVSYLVCRCMGCCFGFWRLRIHRQLYQSEWVRLQRCSDGRRTQTRRLPSVYFGQ